MDKHYPKRVVDYAIDNKISLEEAHKQIILNKEQKIDKVQSTIDNFSLEKEKEWLDSLYEATLEAQDEQISKEEIKWVEAQLEIADKLYDEMYRKDM